jgi:hypothetical protein
MTRLDEVVDVDGQTWPPGSSWWSCRRCAHGRSKHHDAVDTTKEMVWSASSVAYWDSVTGVAAADDALGRACSRGFGMRENWQKLNKNAGRHIDHAEHHRGPWQGLTSPGSCVRLQRCSGFVVVRPTTNKWCNTMSWTKDLMRGIYWCKEFGSDSW